MKWCLPPSQGERKMCLSFGRLGRWATRPRECVTRTLGKKM